MKKKAYLYLGLLGVGLMLGGLSALISKNAGGAYAAEIECYDSTPTYGCPSGSTEIGKYCTTDVIDAYSSSACKGKGGTWIDDVCYQTVVVLKFFNVLIIIDIVVKMLIAIVLNLVLVSRIVMVVGKKMVVHLLLQRVVTIILLVL